MFVVADVRLYREGLAEALASDPAIAVVGTARSVGEAALPLADEAPDAVLLTTPLEEAHFAVARLRELVPGARVIAIAVREVDQDVVAWAEAGVDGLLTSDAGVDTLIAAVGSTARDELLCTPRTAGTLLRRVRDRAPDGAGGRLTRREREIAELMARGLSNKEIARALQIEVPTVKNHVHHILEKLGVRRRGQAAVRLGLGPGWGAEPDGHRE